MTVNPLVICGKCQYCIIGEAQLCGSRSLLGADRRETVCRLLKLDRADRLVICGAGPIGLFALQAAQVFGIRDIVDMNQSGLEIAKEFGGIAVTALEQAESVQPGGFDAAIDAIGAEITRLKCVQAVRRGGRVIFTGLHEAESKLPVNDSRRSYDERCFRLFGARL